MALNRHDALKITNAILDQTARIGLAGITLDVAMISVWGTYCKRERDAVALAAQHNVVLNEEELRELGIFWVRAWQLGQPGSGKCPLCDTPTTDEKALCICFQHARVGKYIDYEVPGRIQELAERDPNGWRAYTAEAFICKTCKQVSDITLGKIASRIRRGLAWTTPRFCIPCATEHRMRKRDFSVQVVTRQLPAPDTPPLAELVAEDKQCT